MGKSNSKRSSAAPGPAPAVPSPSSWPLRLASSDEETHHLLSPAQSSRQVTLAASASTERRPRQIQSLLLIVLLACIRFVVMSGVVVHAGQAYGSTSQFCKFFTPNSCEGAPHRLIGSTNNPTSENTQHTTGAGPLNPMRDFFWGASSILRPALVDQDGDGDIDVWVGHKGGTLFYYENTGTTVNPQYTQRIGQQNPMEGVDVGRFSSPFSVDYDNDGDFDIWVGGDYCEHGCTPIIRGLLYYFENVGNSTRPVFMERKGVQNPMDGILTASFRPKPVFVDFDYDGDLDIWVGGYWGGLKYFENTGDAKHPEYTERKGHPLMNVNIGKYAAPALVDHDNDGDLDMFIGSDGGRITFYENTGSAKNPRFTKRTGAGHPMYVGGSFVKFGSFSAPVWVDFDNDGDEDLWVGTSEDLSYFENIKVPQYSSKRLREENPLHIKFGDYSTPTVIDYDGDGDFDIWMGSRTYGLRYYENVGTVGKQRQQSITRHEVEAMSRVNSVPVISVFNPMLANPSPKEMALQHGQQRLTMKMAAASGCPEDRVNRFLREVSYTAAGQEVGGSASAVEDIEDALEVCMDGDGREYVWDPKTGESKWKDCGESGYTAAGQEVGGSASAENINTEIMDVGDSVEDIEDALEVYMDGDGREYVWDPKTGESKWKDCGESGSILD